MISDKGSLFRLKVQGSIAQLQAQKIGWRSRKRLLLRAAEIFKAAKKAVRLKHGCGSG
jgi:hypothetical protein